MKVAQYALNAIQSNHSSCHYLGLSEYVALRQQLKKATSRSGFLVNSLHIMVRRHDPMLTNVKVGWKLKEVA